MIKPRVTKTARQWLVDISGHKLYASCDWRIALWNAHRLGVILRLVRQDILLEAADDLDRFFHTQCEHLFGQTDLPASEIGAELNGIETAENRIRDLVKEYTDD